VIDLITASFREAEPLTVINQVSKEEFRAFCKIVVEQVEPGLSLILRDTNTNEIVCVSISDRMHAEYKGVSGEGISKVLDIVNLLEDKFLQDHHDCKKGAPNANLYHIFLVATPKQHTKKGLLSKLMEHSIQFARDKGFSGYLVEATNPVTAIVFTKLGADVYSKLRLADHVNNLPQQYEANYVTIMGKLWTDDIQRK